MLASVKRLKVKSTAVAYESDRLPYVLERNYIPDFTITFKDGRVLYVEAKGYLRPADRAKMIAVKKRNPDLDIRFVFAKDNTLGSGSKTRYSEWATKNNFPYTIGTEVPKEWLR